MQVTIATPACATPSKPPCSKFSAYAALAASRSSKSWSVTGSATGGSVARQGSTDAQTHGDVGTARLGAPQECQCQHRGDEGADGGAGEHGVLLGDPGLPEQGVEGVAPGAASATDLAGG